MSLGIELASGEHASVTFLHVVPPLDFIAGRASLPAVPRRLGHVGDEALDEAVFAADRRGVSFERDVVAGDTGETIAAVAEAIDADVVVLGESPSRSALSRRVRGSVLRRVRRHSTRPVFVAPAPSG